MVTELSARRETSDCCQGENWHDRLAGTNFRWPKYKASCLKGLALWFGSFSVALQVVISLTMFSGFILTWRGKTLTQPCHMLLS